jgi:hypothetical protein
MYLDYFISDRPGRSEADASRRPSEHPTCVTSERRPLSLVHGVAKLTAAQMRRRVEEQYAESLTYCPIVPKRLVRE